MKKILFINLFIGCAIFSSGQGGNRQYDSLIKRIVERSIISDGCAGCVDTGVALLKIIKTDNIVMKSIYASSVKYDYANDSNLLKRLNERGRNYIQEEYTVIVPIYFYYSDKKPSTNMMKTMEDKLKEIALTTHVMEPVIIITYETQRKMESGR
ncbi:MAG TPA: hypothetical protein VFI06_08640 [Chitinophagaceae bacterium]|nr:hypothetical protein [Chitinophagaceae bacterium]